MTLETAIFTALRSLVSDRVYPSTFPQAPSIPVWPAIRYTFISIEPVVDILGDGDDTTADSRIQIDAVASTFTAARYLRLEIMNVMRLFDPPAILEFSSAEYDADSKTHRSILDYAFYPSSETGDSPP